MTITWADRIANLNRALGRRPTLDEMLTAAEIHQMTPAEIEAQRRSWVRGITARCKHGELDFEQCSQCRGDQWRGKQQMDGHTHDFAEVLFAGDDGLTRRCKCGARLWEPDTRPRLRVYDSYHGGWIDGGPVATSDTNDGPFGTIKSELQ